MDKDELQKNIALYYSKLPPKAQEFFSKMEWLATLGKISEKYGLNDKQKETLGTETTLLLLGIIHPVEYEENISSELALDSNSFERILKDIENSMLLDVRQQLVETYNANKKSETEQAVEPEAIEIKPQPNIVQKLDARFDKLPENIRGLVEKSNYQTTLYEIARVHKLSVTQMGTLDTITTDLIVGAIHPDEFKKAVIKGLELSEDETTSLVNDINEKVFKSIRGQLMGINAPEPKKPEIQTLKSDLDTLKSHGIDIVTEKLEIEAPHPILAQKLSTSVQASKVKNEYELKTGPVKNEEIKNTTTQTPKTSAYPAKADPYREIPE